MDEFQSSTSSKQGSNAKHKRVYIGNLPRTFESRQALQESLEQFIREKIPNINIESMQVNTSGKGKSPHALLECGPTQINQVIRVLNQQNWQGQRLNVQREKRNNNPSTGTSSTKSNKPGFGGQNWQSPTAPIVTTTTEEGTVTNLFAKIPIDQATRDIQTVVQEEIKDAEESGDDMINVALATTAAASFMAAMNAIAMDDPAFDDPEHDSVPTNWEQKLQVYDEYDDGDDGDEILDRIDEPGAAFQLKPMAELLADFGQADPNWKQKQVDSGIDPNPNDAPTSQLAPKGKAPIHICLTSFGFSKGAPKRMDGWSYRQPLLPLDCRDFPTVPHYLAWQDGLSGAVKRALQYPQPQDRTKCKEELEPTLYDYARKTVATQVWKALLEAQDQGGHGYVSPLEMTIFVGSESGRHRSVVVCEWAAIELRKLLRKNMNHVVKQPVSVGSFHRDVESHRQFQSKSKTSLKVGSETAQHQGKTIKKKHMDFAGDW